MPLPRPLRTKVRKGGAILRGGTALPPARAQERKSEHEDDRCENRKTVATQPARIHSPLDCAGNCGLSARPVLVGDTSDELESSKTLVRNQRCKHLQISKTRVRALVKSILKAGSSPRFQRSFAGVAECWKQSAIGGIFDAAETRKSSSK